MTTQSTNPPKAKPRMAENVTTRKVAGISIASAIATLIVFGVNRFVMNESLPAEVSAAAMTLLAYVVGYYVRPSMRDQVVT